MAKKKNKDDSENWEEVDKKMTGEELVEMLSGDHEDTPEKLTPLSDNPFYNVSKEKVLQDLNDVIKYITYSGEVEDAIKAKIDELINGYQSQFKYFLTAYAKNRIAAVGPLLEALGTCEEVLLSKEVLAEAKKKPWTLARIHSQISGSLQNIVDLVISVQQLEVAPTRDPKVIQNNFYTSVNLPNNKHSKMRIRKGIDEILKVARADNDSDITSIEVDRTDIDVDDES